MFSDHLNLRIDVDQSSFLFFMMIATPATDIAAITPATARETPASPVLGMLPPLVGVVVLLTGGTSVVVVVSLGFVVVVVSLGFVVVVESLGFVVVV